MSTIGLESWAVDLKDVGPVYPFQGHEFFMVIIGIAFWLLWHVIQLRNEAAEVRHEMEADASGEKTRAAIDRY